MGSFDHDEKDEDWHILHLLSFVAIIRIKR